MISYKGYLGTVEYSAEDTVFWGKIYGINDVVTFESDTAAGIEPAFHEAVDDYLETCKQIGKNPEKTFTGNFNVRIPEELHKKLYFSALKEKKSINKILLEKLEKSYG